MRTIRKATEQIRERYEEFELSSEIHTYGAHSAALHNGQKSPDVFIALGMPGAKKREKKQDHLSEVNRVLSLDSELTAAVQTGIPKLIFLNQRTYSDVLDVQLGLRPEQITENISNVAYGTFETFLELQSLLVEHVSQILRHSADIIQAPPEQGSGPHFALDESTRITNIPTMVTEGDDRRRIKQLLPLIRESMQDLLIYSQSLANQYPNVLRDVKRYDEVLSVEEGQIEWGIVWGLGARIETATASAERSQIDRLAPAMEDEVLSALQALRNLHGPLILATQEGRELQEQADRLQMSRTDQERLRNAASAIAGKLQRHDEIIEQQAAALVLEAVDNIGKAPHPERGTVYGIATIKNLAIVLSCAAIAGAPAFYTHNNWGNAVTMSIWEVLKKSPKFGTAVEELSKHIGLLDNIGRMATTSAAIHKAEIKTVIEQLAPFRSFVIANHTSLQQITETTAQLRWMKPYIDYIVRTA